jgi:hypothetical protein
MPLERAANVLLWGCPPKRTLEVSLFSEGLAETWNLEQWIVCMMESKKKPSPSSLPHLSFVAQLSSHKAAK